MDLVSYRFTPSQGTKTMKNSAILILAIAMLAAPTLLGQGVGRNGIKKGEWKDRTDIPEGFFVYERGRYVFQSNAPKERIEQLAKHLNEAYRLYEKSFPTGRTPGKPFVVKVFKDRKQFIEYGAPPSAGAYYSWGDKEMVGYDTGKVDGEMVGTGGTTGKSDPVKSAADAIRAQHTMDLLGVFAHEGWHQYFHFICASKVDFPSWCDEGIGEYFYTARFRGRKMEVGAPNDYRLGTIRAAIKSKKTIPLKDLVTYNQAAYYRVAGLAYAQGWSFVHFLMEHPDYKKHRHLQKFLNIFIDQHSIQEAVDEVFRKFDWEKVEKDWSEWVLALPYESAEDIRRRALEEVMEPPTEEGK
jgi:hypothetical protein